MKKRIALAAAAALAGGLLVAAPASAAGPVTVLDGPTTAVAGASNFVAIDVTLDNDANNALVTVSGSTIWGGSTTSTVLSNDGVVKVATPAVGTITVKVYDDLGNAAGQFNSTAADTHVITVTAAPVAPTYSKTVVYQDWIDDASYKNAAGEYFLSSEADYEGVDFRLDQVDSNGDTITAGSSLLKAYTIAIDGPGYVCIGDCGTHYTYIAVPAETSNNQSYWFFADGRSGKTTITFAVAGVTVATKTIYFYGAAKTFSVSIDKKQIQANDSDEAIVTVTAKDANGYAVPDALTVWKSDSATVSGSKWSSTPGTESFTVTAAAKAAAVITVGNNTVDTKTIVANFVTPGIETITVTADKASYGPGEQATFTVTAVNEDGVTAGDATYTGGSISASASVIGLATGASMSFVDGKTTFKGYMPLAQGPVKVSVQAGSDVHAVGSVSVTVVDAAAVANAAAITALQTSVATLTTTVASLVASMTAQIKVINATMLKIQKAIAALRLQVKKLA